MIKKIILWFMKADYKRMNDLDKKNIRSAVGLKSITYLLEGKRDLADLWYEFYEWTITENKHE